MRIFQPTELLIHTVALGEKSGITYRQYWAFRHGGNPYPEKVLETVSIGRRVGETFPLKYPLLPVRLPRVRGMGKRELWAFLAEETERNRPYLDRVGTVLAKGIESYLRDETTGTAETAFVWVRLPRRYAFLGTLLGPGDADVDDGEKPP